LLASHPRFPRRRLADAIRQPRQRVLLVPPDGATEPCFPWSTGGSLQAKAHPDRELQIEEGFS